MVRRISALGDVDIAEERVTHPLTEDKDLVAVPASCNEN